MASFPTLTSGRVAMNGTEQISKFGTGVLKFSNGSEQRWQSTRKLFEGSIVFTSVNGYDFGKVMEFFRSNKGQKDTTWDITIDGTLWSYMTFRQDDLPFFENKNGRFSFTLKCGQVRKN